MGAVSPEIKSKFRPSNVISSGIDFAKKSQYKTIKERVACTDLSTNTTGSIFCLNNNYRSNGSLCLS